MNEIKEKILLLLFGGLALGCCYTPHQQRRVLRAVSREWKKIDRKKFRDGVNYLYRQKYISKKIKNDSLVEFSITDKGKFWAINKQLDNIKNKKEKWDGKWRMVAFDVPEKHKKGRDMLRQKLKNIGFCEFQKSVFITPYDCKKEIALLVEYYKISKYVRFGVLEFIDNEGVFRKLFKLPVA